MSALNSQFFDGTRKQPSAPCTDTQHHCSEPGLDIMTEYIIENVDPRIRGIYQYARKLAEPVKISEYYLESLLDKIPGELEISYNSFTVDPRIRLLFKNTTDMQRVFGRSYKLKELLTLKVNRNLKNIYAILCMDKSEQTTFVVSWKNEIPVQEVKQHIVHFSNYRLIGPAITLNLALQAFKKFTFDRLLKIVKQIIANYSTEYQDLVKQKVELLKIIQHEDFKKNIDSDSVFDHYYSIFHNPELESLEREIIKQKFKILSPEQHLEQLCGVLRYPERFIKVTKTTLAPDRFSVMSAANAQRYGYKIDLAEIDIAQSTKRYAVVVRYPTSNLQILSTRSPVIYDVFG